MKKRALLKAQLNRTWKIVEKAKRPPKTIK